MKCRFIHFIHLPLACVYLTACEPLNLTYPQVLNQSDQQLCQLSTHDWMTESTSSLIRQEMTRREVDCHPHHADCVSYGLTKGTKDYADCRLKLSQQASQEQIMNDMIQGFSTMQQEQFIHEDKQLYRQQMVPAQSNVYHHFR